MYGYCSKCDNLLTPKWAIQSEYQTYRGIQTKTGRIRKAIAYLECKNCFHKELIDDTFDGQWTYDIMDL